MERRKAVAIIVENNGKVILGQKRRDPNSTLSGEWHILGETAEGNETPEETIRRGLIEEVGLKDVEVIEEIAFHQTPKGTIVHWYRCSTSTKDLIVGSDLVDARWVSINDVANACGEVARSLWPEEVKAIFINE